MSDTLPKYTPEERRKRVKAIVAAASGNLVEWFDFYIYAFFVKYFTEALMPSSMPHSEKELLGWLAFSASFFMRPLGSWLFGWMADKYGRKQSMLVSIVMMGVGSFCFALLPSYETVGLLAPVLLLTVRLFQGLSVGGEYGAVATYMSEIALRGRRGFFASFQYVTLSGGQLLASALSLICLIVFSEQELKDGWWRLPFFIGGIAAFVSLWVRRTLEETTTAEERNRKESGSLVALFKYHWKAFFTVVGYTAAGSLSFYIITVYAKDYIANTGIPVKTVSYMMTAGLFVFIILQPLMGLLSDKIGRRANMLCFSSLMAIGIYPCMALGMKGNADSPIIVFFFLIILMTILSFYTSISGLVKAEMFPKEVRALGVGLSYAVANAIFGGSAPSVARLFEKYDMANEFFVYVIVMLIICFLCSLRLPKKPDYLHDEH